MNLNNKIVLGIMSGSSLDGLDLAMCRFSKHNEKWSFDLLDSKTIPYPEKWKVRLGQAGDFSGRELIKLDAEYGKFIGQQAASFINDINIKAELISSHGHTVFHQPDIGITFQLGSGADIAAITGITSVTDFRRTDVALGGQGAPLVPVGDELLFNSYDYCLNLGGFANVSYNESGQRIAFDICPVNIILNRMMQMKGQPYDKDGLVGRSGKVNTYLLESLNNLPFYQANHPKSLGKEWLINEFTPIVDKSDIPLNDKLRTIYEHITIQIARIPDNDKNILLTGGGTHNVFLVELIKKNCSVNFVIPDKSIIEYKEAIIFALLGLLRIEGEINCLASVTGAAKDNCCGAVYLGNIECS
jgi:anhydro-N-acetylmuramic acid kinase